MTEQDRYPRRSGDITSPESPVTFSAGAEERAESAASEIVWDIAELAATLERGAFAIHDVAHGDGTRFPLDSDASRRLEVYPQANVVRLDVPGARLELYRQGAPTLQPHGLRFDQEADDGILTVAVAASGAVTLWLAPSQPVTDAPRTGESPWQGIDLPQEQETALLAHPGAVDRPDSAPVEPRESPPVADRSDPEQREQPRVDLRGRVGRDPAVRRTPRGTLLARFPLAVQEEGQRKPTWHQILSFGERAARVQETVTQGQQVTVIGYPHQREVPQKDGSIKLVEEIYAVVVKPSKPEGTQAGS